MKISGTESCCLEKIYWLLRHSLSVSLNRSATAKSLFQTGSGSENSISATRSYSSIFRSTSTKSSVLNQGNHNCDAKYYTTLPRHYPSSDGSLARRRDGSKPYSANELGTLLALLDPSMKKIWRSPRSYYCLLWSGARGCSAGRLWIAPDFALLTAPYCIIQIFFINTTEKDILPNHIISLSPAAGYTARLSSSTTLTTESPFPFSSIVPAESARSSALLPITASPASPFEARARFPRRPSLKTPIATTAIRNMAPTTTPAIQARLFESEAVAEPTD